MFQKHEFEYMNRDKDGKVKNEVIYVLASSKEDAERALKVMSLEPTNFVYMGIKE